MVVLIIMADILEEQLHNQLALREDLVIVGVAGMKEELVVAAVEPAVLVLMHC